MTTKPGAADDGRTVLVVEDDVAVRELIRKTLAPLGSRLLVAGSAVEAAALAAETHVDLLLTDVVLPGENGTVLALTLRADRPALRVIYMTGWHEHAALADIPDGFQLFRKPFDLSDLARAVTTALDDDA
jgi:CheY-like chemotaxis protein